MICKYVSLICEVFHTVEPHKFQANDHKINSPKAATRISFFSLPKALDYLCSTKCLKAFKALWFFWPHGHLICKPLWHKQEILLAHLWRSISHPVMKKIVWKARQQLMKNLLKHLRLDPTDTDTTASPLGRLNSTLGKREEMGEYYAFLCELLKSTSGFLIDEKYIVFFSYFNSFYR